MAAECDNHSATKAGPDIVSSSLLISRPREHSSPVSRGLGLKTTVSRSWSQGKGPGSRPRPDSTALLPKIYIYCYNEKQTMHCLTISCSVQFISAKLAEL